MSATETMAEPIAGDSELHPKQMTYEQFRAWANEDTHAEWVNGEVIEFMPPKNRHQMMLDFLSYLIKSFVDVFQLGVVRVAPLEVRVQPKGNAREPDLLFIANEHRERLTEDRVSGPPDLIVEIVSDDSVNRDRVAKFDEYEAAGVPEYWIIDNRPERQRAYFYQLNEAGQYRSITLDAEDVYRSRVLASFWLKVAWLWEEPPNALRAVAAVIGPERMAQALRDAANT